MTDLVGRVALRVEFLLKTDGGYPRDAGVFILLTMANPGSCFRVGLSPNGLPASRFQDK